MHKTFEKNFSLMPQDCNYTQKVVFGGKMLSEMDAAAGICVSRLLRSSDTTDNGVTILVNNVKFHAPSYCGEFIFIAVEVVELRKRAIKMNIRVEKEERTVEGRTLVATGEFVFSSKCGDTFVNHGLVL